MNRTKIAQLYADADAFAGKTVTVAGWVKSVRDMKNFGFVTLNDGSCFKDLQVVMNRATLENYDEIAHQNVSAALVCEGVLKLTPDAPQPFELAAESIRVEGASAPDYPLQKKRATPEFLRTQQHLRPRTNLFRAVFRIRSVARRLHPPLLPRPRVRLCAHAHHHGERLRRGRRDVPRDHHRPGPGTARERGGCRGLGRRACGRRGGLERRLLRQARLAHRVRPAERRELRHGLRGCVHVRPHLPRGELQHGAPCRRVLDGGARDCLRRP